MMVDCKHGGAYTAQCTASDQGVVAFATLERSLESSGRISWCRSEEGVVTTPNHIASPFHHFPYWFWPRRKCQSYFIKYEQCRATFWLFPIWLPSSPHQTEFQVGILAFWAISTIRAWRLGATTSGGSRPSKGLNCDRHHHLNCDHAMFPP